MSDVWELTDKDKGDHVLIALTPEECVSLLTLDTVYMGKDEHIIAAKRVHEEVRRCLRDQKGIEL